MSAVPYGAGAPATSPAVPDLPAGFHGLAVRELRTAGAREVGTTLNRDRSQAASDRPEDLAGPRRAEVPHNEVWTEPLFAGATPRTRPGPRDHAQRFGLVHADHRTLTRTPEDGYHWYRGLITAHRARTEEPAR
ncbi:hypothetical protein ACFVHB_06815 [Kitasatospora sp. NPDC127111]|uniref:hypothetical protein n=1 Tax=Kitasatospora sp. NPDC127111 TaxID=3345363 RepID=UPI003625B187